MWICFDCPFGFAIIARLTFWQKNWLPVSPAQRITPRQNMSKFDLRKMKKPKQMVGLVSLYNIRTLNALERNAINQSPDDKTRRFWSKNYYLLQSLDEALAIKAYWVRSNEKNTKKVDPFQNWFFVISDHYWTGLGWFKPFFAFRGPIGAVGGQFWVLGVLKGRKFEISKLDHFWPWDAIFLT